MQGSGDNCQGYQDPPHIHHNLCNLWIKSTPTFSTSQLFYCIIQGIEDWGEFGNSNHVKNLIKMGRYPGNRRKLFIFLYFVQSLNDQGDSATVDVGELFDLEDDFACTLI